ncbi:MAG TPA: tyrosine-type recombinase/integrase [Candidatus Saccharimonadales bacterium]|nr:tyrosine-type recombinase/integrase [Candidatus Saccharimonadales bacterium]
MIKLEIAQKSFVKHLENEGRSSSTLIAYGKDIEQLTDFLSKKGVNLVHEIELAHLEEFMAKLANESYTPKSISRKTNSTKTFFKFLVDKGHIQSNVADQLKHPKVDLKAPRILSKLEYRALRDAAKDDSRTFAIIETLLQTGLTISELADIKIENMDITKEPGSLYIPKKQSKDFRTVPLNKAAIDGIKKYMDNDRPKDKKSEYLFITKTGKALLVRNIRSTIDRYFKLAGVEHAKVNDLRHTFVAHHLAQGASLLQVSKIAGHKRISTTERYLQYIERNGEEEKSELGVL